MINDEKVACSFCAENDSEERGKLFIKGDNGAICDDCVKICCTILVDHIENVGKITRNKDD